MIWRGSLPFVEEHNSQAALPLISDEAEGNRPAQSAMTHNYTRLSSFALSVEIRSEYVWCYGAHTAFRLSKETIQNTYLLINHLINKLERWWWNKCLFGREDNRQGDSAYPYRGAFLLLFSFFESACRLKYVWLIEIKTEPLSLPSSFRQTEISRGFEKASPARKSCV